MGKMKAERRLGENEAMAVSRLLRTSPQKLNLVAAMIRGKPVSQALSELRFSKRRIAGDVSKCLMSASFTLKNKQGGSLVYICCL